MQYEHIKLFKEAGFQQSIHRIYLKFQNMIYIYISSFILNVSEPWSPYLESKFSDTDSNTPTSNDTKSNSCNSPARWEGVWIFKAEKNELSLCGGNFGSSSESEMLKLYWFHAYLTQVNVDNVMHMHIHVHMNTCHN